MNGASGSRASSSPSRRISCAWRSFLVVRLVMPGPGSGTFKCARLSLDSAGRRGGAATIGEAGHALRALVLHAAAAVGGRGSQGQPLSGDLEGVRVAAQHQQLVAAAERHAGGHVQVPAHVAAGVVGLVLFLVNLQQDVAPRGRQGKVRVGVRRLRLQPAAAEGQVVLVLKGDLRVAECLVHLKLLALGHCARVVAVHRSHVSQQARRSGEWEILPRTALNLTYKTGAVAALCPLSPMSADRRAAAVAALTSQPPVHADRRAAAVAALCPLSPMLADRRPAAVAALSPPPPMHADGRPAAVAALVPQPPVSADGRAAAVATLSPPPPMHADRRAAAVAALTSQPPVRALLVRPAHRRHLSWCISSHALASGDANEMLRWFRKTYPSYNLQPLLLKRYRELEEARAFNNWLGERRQAQETT